MTLKEQISADLKAAMKAGDEGQRNTLRQLLAGFQQAELEKRSAAAKARSKAGPISQADLAELEQTSLDESEAIGVIQKEAKSRRESILDAQKANRADLAAGYEAELAMIEAYLPRQLNRDEVAAMARVAIAEAGATDAKQVGAVMKLLTLRVKGQADGRLVSEVVRELLAAK